MTWSDVLGHDRIREMFATAIQRNRLGNTFLFVGPAAIGKRKFALTLAQTLLCSRSEPEAMNPCGICEDCQQVKSGSHPDLIVVRKPKEKSRIPIELLIGDDKHRMQTGLCHDVHLRPFRGKRKIAIIDDADDLNAEGANCLLKTLEEPPADCVLILVSQGEQRQLPTIRSRCQIIRFAPLPDEIIAQLLQDMEWVQNADEAKTLARQSKGSLARAEDLRDEKIQEIAQVLLETIAKPDFHSVQLAKDLSGFLQKLGDDAPKKRAALSHLFELVIDQYRNWLYEATENVDGESSRNVRNAAPAGIEGLLACIDRCTLAEIQLDSNANISTLVECWLDDLATASRLGYFPVS